MNGRFAYPFLTLSECAVKSTSWQIALDSEDWSEAGDFLAGWDSSSTIRLKRELEIDFDSVSSDLDLDQSELNLSLGIRIGTGSGRFPRLISHQEYREINPSGQPIVLEQSIAGDSLSLILDITVEILLAEQPSTTGTLSPEKIGDRLWLDDLRIRLEGEEPRFPIEVSELQSILGDVTAVSSPWYLHWSPRDWGRDFHGAMRLYLNSDRPAIVERIESQDAATLQAVMGDVMSQVCERFLNEHETVDMTGEFEPGTLGAQAVAWLKLAWPLSDFCYISSVLEHRPGDFRAAFLALAEIGDS